MQCDFRKGHSGQHCLLVSIEKYRKVLDKRGFAGFLRTDLSKPFDCIDHELLIAKLHAYGFDIKSLELIHSIFMAKSKELKLTLHLATEAMQNQVYHKDQLKELFFLRFIYVTYSLTL